MICSIFIIHIDIIIILVELPPVRGFFILWNLYFSSPLCKVHIHLLYCFGILQQIVKSQNV